MNGENMDTDKNGQMAGQMPHQRVRAMWQVSRVDQNGRKENGQVVPEHKFVFRFPDLQSLAQALPASNQQPTPNQLPASPQPPFSYYQPQRYRHHRITVPQGYPQPNPNAIPAEVFDTHMMPAIAAFMAGDFRKAAYKTFQAFILAISLYNREIVTEYHREDSGDHDMHDVANAEAWRRLQENAFRVQTMVTDLEAELNRRQMLGTEPAQELHWKLEVVRKLRDDVIPHVTEILVDAT